MPFIINLDEVDKDGAIREAADAVAGDTRLSFLRKAGIGAGAAVSTGAILSAFAGEAFAASGTPPTTLGPLNLGTGDIGILNYALTLEHLERAFYNEATAAGKIHHPQLKTFLEVERAHVKFLTAALGSKAVASPTFDFKGIPANEKLFAATAQVLENTGVHAYLGQAGNLVSKAYLAAAASIVTIEARHAGAIGLINHANGGIAPSGAFDTPYTASKVINAVVGTGFIKAL